MIVSIFINKNNMKKIIRLTESDLTRIVRRVINEQSENNKLSEDAIYYLNKYNYKRRDTRFEESIPNEDGSLIKSGPYSPMGSIVYATDIIKRQGGNDHSFPYNQVWLEFDIKSSKVYIIIAYFNYKKQLMSVVTKTLKYTNDQQSVDRIVLSLGNNISFY
jgi:hypothetical protein